MKSHGPCYGGNAIPKVTHPELLEKIAERLQELEPDIKRMARRWARDCPDDWEDLAQEARLAIHQQLEEQPDTPRNHLFQVAKRGIVDYRKRGKSVDGKLYRTYKRRVVWALVSLDAPDVVPAEYSGLYFRPHQLRPVEDLALEQVAYETMMRRLTEQQARYLSLRLQGYSGRQVDALMGVTQWGGRLLREAIQRQAQDILLPALPAPPLRPPAPARAARTAPAPAVPAGPQQTNLF